MDAKKLETQQIVKSNNLNESTTKCDRVTFIYLLESNKKLLQTHENLQEFMKHPKVVEKKLQPEILHAIGTINIAMNKVQHLSIHPEEIILIDKFFQKIIARCNSFNIQYHLYHSPNFFYKFLGMENNFGMLAEAVADIAEIHRFITNE